MFPVTEHVIADALEQQTNHTRLGYISSCIGELAAVEAQSGRFVHACLHDLPWSRSTTGATANRPNGCTITNQKFNIKDSDFMVLYRWVSLVVAPACFNVVVRRVASAFFRAAGRLL